MQPGPKIGVVGVGTIGAQVLYELARRRCQVTGFELYRPGHSNGAAGGESRIFRTIQVENVAYEPIVREADLLYRQLEDKSGFQLREMTGALLIVKANTTEARRALDAAERSPGKSRILLPNEAQEEFPQILFDADDIAIWDDQGGIIRPELTVSVTARLAQAAGARMVQESRVTDIQDLGEAGVRVVTESGGGHTFDRVIVAAGAWTPKLLPGLREFIDARRLVSAWYSPKSRKHLEGVPPFVRTTPTYIHETRTYVYGLPNPDRSMVKLGLGLDVNEPVVSPDGINLNVPKETLDIYSHVARQYLTYLETYPTKTESYFESYTKSGYEFIQPHPEMPNVIVMAGFSGRGFKMAPAYGRVGADLALGKEPSLDISFMEEGTNR